MPEIRGASAHATERVSKEDDDGRRQRQDPLWPGSRFAPAVSRHRRRGAPRGAGGQAGTTADQGVCLQVVGTVDGAERELLRFECLDNHPALSLRPGGRRTSASCSDPTVTGNPTPVDDDPALRRKLPAMLGRAGYEQIALQIDPSQLMPALDEVEAQNVRDGDPASVAPSGHNRGTGCDRGRQHPVRPGDAGSRSAGTAAWPFTFSATSPARRSSCSPSTASASTRTTTTGRRYKNERIYLTRRSCRIPSAWALDQFKVRPGCRRC